MFFNYIQSVIFAIVCANVLIVLPNPCLSKSTTMTTKTNPLMISSTAKSTDKALTKGKTTLAKNSTTKAFSYNITSASTIESATVSTKTVTSNKYILPIKKFPLNYKSN
jgi:hypothetical protein